MLWRWPWGHHLEVSVLPNGKRQRPEGKLGAERELHAESIRCHGLSGWILSAFPYLMRPRRRCVIRYLEYDREKRDDARLILRMNTTSFRLVQALSLSNSHISSIIVLCCEKTMNYLSKMHCRLLLLYSRELPYRYDKFPTLLQSQQTHI
jgi:hypothetical protein